MATTSTGATRLKPSRGVYSLSQSIATPIATLCDAPTQVSHVAIHCDTHCDTLRRPDRRKPPSNFNGLRLLKSCPVPRCRMSQSIATPIATLCDAPTVDVPRGSWESFNPTKQPDEGVAIRRTLRGPRLAQDGPARRRRWPAAQDAGCMVARRARADPGGDATATTSTGATRLKLSRGGCS
jgi:hypothetical protein